MARELALPVRRNETKGVPSFRAPGFCESVLFKDNVVDSPFLQSVAGREPGLSAADYRTEKCFCDGAAMVDFITV